MNNLILKQLEEDGILVTFGLQSLDYKTLKSEDFGNKYENLLTLLDYLESVKKQVNEACKAVLKETNEEYEIKTAETDRLIFTLVEPTTRVSVDTTKLKKEMPEVYIKYLKTSLVAESLKVTVRKEKQNGNN